MGGFGNSAMIAKTTDPTALPTALPASQYEPVNCNLQKVLLVQQADLEPTKDIVSQRPAAGVSVSASTAYEASRVVKAGAGQLIGLIGYNSLAGAQWVQVHNTSSLPADGVAPVLTQTVAATSNFFIPLHGVALDLGTGITVCNSTTGPTKTIGAANCYFTALYT